MGNHGEVAHANLVADSLKLERLDPVLTDLDAPGCVQLRHAACLQMLLNPTMRGSDDNARTETGMMRGNDSRTSRAPARILGRVCHPTRLDPTRPDKLAPDAFGLEHLVPRIGPVDSRATARMVARSERVAIDSTVRAATDKGSAPHVRGSPTVSKSASSLGQSTGWKVRCSA